MKESVKLQTIMKSLEAWTKWAGRHHFFIEASVSKTRLRIINCCPRISFKTESKKNICGPRQINVDQFGPSSGTGLFGLGTFLYI